VEVRNKLPSDESWIREVLQLYFGSETLVSRGVAHHAIDLPGFVAVSNEAPAGILLYNVVGDECEVVALVAVQGGIGAGRRLFKETENFAKANSFSRLWLITTNENTAAIRFYNSAGWNQVAIHRGAVRESRKLKPEIPEFAPDGTPIEDEIEFEFPLYSE
jgi:N-acetylglutamate synthase-like GNAT family acetyltransferase